MKFGNGIIFLVAVRSYLLSPITKCIGIIDQIDRSPNSYAERAILETLKGSKYTKDDYDLINPIFGTYINGSTMHQSQITLAKDVDLQTEIIQYIMSKCLDNFERYLILIDCAQVNAKYKPEYKMTTKHFFSLSTRCRGKS